MKKRVLSLLLCAVLSLSLVSGALAAATEATPFPNVKVILDGKLIPADVYAIDSSIYLKLKDISFAVGVHARWDSDAAAVRLETGMRPQPRDASEPSGATKKVEATPFPNVKVTLDGETIPASVYSIEGSVFLKLSDIAAALGLGAGWDGDTATAVLTTALTPEEIAAAYVQLLIEGSFDDADAMLDAAMTAVMEEMDGTEAFFQTIAAQTGALVSIAGVTLVAEQDEVLIILVSVQAELGVFHFYVVIDTDGYVAGLQVLPSVEVEDPITMPEGFVESEITIDAGCGFPLEGRLVMPKDADEDVPLVVLVQGSGATNYDEIAGANRVFGQIAYGLAERGIASLRYDKRNYAYPEIMAEPDYSIFEEYLEDVLTAVEFASALEGVSEIYILGHSQGGMLAPLFAAESEDIAGMILFAGTPRSFFDILDDQQADLLAYYEAAGMTETVEAYKAMQEVWKAERDALLKMTEEEALKAGTVYGMGAYYLWLLEQYDAIAIILELEIPTLILQGSADFQVYADVDYQLYLDALSDEDYVEFILYKGLNHMFMPSEAKNLMEAIAEYDVQSSIPAKVFDDIAAWLGLAD
jgi:alpha-beta hydrolase superfamily lysophospholipase